MFSSFSLILMNGLSYPGIVFPLIFGFFEVTVSEKDVFILISFRKDGLCQLLCHNASRPTSHMLSNSVP